MSDTLPLRLVLASASPARRKSLRAAGIEPDVLVSGVDESLVVADRAEDLCLELARLKAEAVLARLNPTATTLSATTNAKDTANTSTESTTTTSTNTASTNTATTSASTARQRTLVIGCDSVLEFDGEILGKPTDAADATRRWLRMRGRSGVLHSGHCLIDGVAGRRAEAVASTVVHFADISDDEIAAYVATGEPLAVAGAFTIDGLGGAFVERIEGDPGTVVGLSMPLLRRLLAELGLQITDLWTKVAPGGQSVEPLGNVHS
ncbi:Maf family protein [Micromonospora sp. NPDC051543]|uniref:Maf family protein n=1 Tax=Micromonospora sp. NPDC051543 TaxID=3364287 RepID=UPI00379AE333